MVMQNRSKPASWRHRQKILRSKMHQLSSVGVFRDRFQVVPQIYPRRASLQLATLSGRFQILSSASVSDLTLSTASAAELSNLFDHLSASKHKQPRATGFNHHAVSIP